MPEKMIDGHSTIGESISIKLDEAVGAATISPSGRDVCLAARKGLFIMNLDDPWATPRFLPYFSDIVADVQWSPHSSRAQWIVSTSGPKALVWNLAGTTSEASSAIEHVCLGHERSITDINWAVFQQDSLATCGIDGNVLCYDLRLGGRSPTARYCGWRYGATQVKYNRQNPNELASSHGEILYIWDDRKGSNPVTAINAHEQKIYGIDYSRKNKDSIVTCSLDSTVKYWQLDGSPSIDQPSHIIHTSSPIWRARHTPFGDGIVTLPQRSEYAVKLWSFTSPHESLNVLSSGHTDVVREFLWRIRGETDPLDDDRDFQLITWGNDRQLLLTPIVHSVTALVGHVPHGSIDVRQTRRNAENRSFRDPVMSPSILAARASLTDAKDVSPSPTDPLAYGVKPSIGSAVPHSVVNSSNLSATGSDTKMTPPIALYSRSARIPLSATIASRYSRSANIETTGSNSSARTSPQLGASPAGKIGFQAIRSSDKWSEKATPGISSSLVDLDEKGFAKPKAEAYMTRTMNRKPDGQDTVSWMENVRVVSGTSTGILQGHARRNSAEVDLKIKTRGRMGNDLISVTNDVSIEERITAPLHEELTATARAFESRVRFEKIAIPSRTVVVALYGPWASSGLSAFLRATFTFPPKYPVVPLNIDIERSSGITNKARAKLLTAVRSTASRFAAKRIHNSLEACLLYLLGGKVLEPEKDSEDVDMYNSSSQYLGLPIEASAEEEDEEIDDEEDLERFLANRNCPQPYRRCGAVFGPRGQLFAFFPLDPVSHPPIHSDDHLRSPSPSGRHKQPQNRRRLFESFGVIPSLQASQQNLDIESLEEDEAGDSDEILNIPTLWMVHRRLSAERHFRERSTSISASQGLRPRLSSRAYNSLIYSKEVKSILGIGLDLSSAYTLQGRQSSIIFKNARLVNDTRATSWLVKRAWNSLQTLSAASATGVNGSEASWEPALILGEKLPEKMVSDMLQLFLKLGDTQMLGMLACLLEMDRRSISRASSVYTPRQFSRSLSNTGSHDYFGMHSSQSSRSNELSDHHHHNKPGTPYGRGASRKSPSNALNPSSYSTQNSSAGSRGSSWANNLSTFFKSSGSEGGKSNILSDAISGQTFHEGVHPAFKKRSATAPSMELRKFAGIASGRPFTSTGPRPEHKVKSVTHVSFATTTDYGVASTSAAKNAGLSNKIIVQVHQVHSSEQVHQGSVLLGPHIQAQLECYRLVYAELLLRLQLPQQRSQVLKLTRASVDGSNKSILRHASGIQYDIKDSISLETACELCGSSVNGLSPGYCGTCQTRRMPVACALCHLALIGLTDTCLSCLHTCHLKCLQEWKQYETACPASCGCNCGMLNPADSQELGEDINGSFKSPPLIT